MLERCARRHARTFCCFAHRDMFNPPLFDDLDSNRDKRLDEIAMVIGLGDFCFSFGRFLGHGSFGITKG